MENTFKCQIKSAIERKQWKEVTDLLPENGANKELQLPVDINAITRVAIRYHAPENIISMLISPQTVNIQDIEGHTLLHQAISTKQWQLVPVLIEAGANINIVNRELDSPLHWAIIFNATPDTYNPQNINLDTITQLISPQNINLRDSCGLTALERTVDEEYWDLVSILLERGADVNNGILPIKGFSTYPSKDILGQLISQQTINEQDDYGYAVLHYAIITRKWEHLSVLLAGGADINLCTIGGFLPSHFALEYDAPADIVNHLISEENINMQDKGQRHTVLHKALARERWKLVPDLIGIGAGINISDATNSTPLLVAVSCGAPADTITLLISQENINRQDEDGYTSLHWAMKRHRWELLPVLIERGADVNIGDYIRRPPMHLLNGKHDPSAEALDQLLSKRNINMQDTQGGHTVLHLVVGLRKWELVPFLVERGSDINISNAIKRTPLHLAVLNYAAEDIIVQLISSQNINMQDKDGSAALHSVMSTEDWDLVPVFIQRGASLNSKDMKSRVPLYLAIEYGAPVDIVTMLISPQTINVTSTDGYTALDVALKTARWHLVPVLLQYGADPGVVKGQGHQPVFKSLQALSIITIRRHMSVKSDEAFENLGLPLRIVSDVKLRPLADEIVRDKRETV